jgi:hypothetical protein
MQDYSLKQFIDNDLRVFSNLDNVRSIPSIVDGFKDSQRKAVFGMLSHGSSEIKVAQLAGHAAMCLHPDTLINVMGKYFKIKDLVGRSNFDLISFNETSNEYEVDNCERAFVSGNTDTFVEIELESGNTIKLTPDHLVLTNSGWKKSVDVNEKDLIVSI